MAKDDEKTEKAAEAEEAPKPLTAEDLAARAPKPVEPSGKTKKMKYTGPEGQVVRGVNEELKSGESYDVPAEIAEQLKASSPFWE